VIAVDTNILVYAHRNDSEFFEPAGKALSHLAERPVHWAIPWPCIHEFLSVSTNPRIFRVPTPIEVAIRQIEIWMESPFLRLIGESRTYWRTLAYVLTEGKIAGPMVHDARIVAICKAHGVQELWSADRDFSRIGGVSVTNPLLPPFPYGRDAA
jgi:toxin-antitoxin system PIN domain toxin